MANQVRHVKENIPYVNQVTTRDVIYYINQDGITTKPIEISHPELGSGSY